MLDRELIKSLKQVNVSTDIAKSSERLKQAYGALSRADKERLITLTGQNRHSLYRAERTGMITAKLLLPAALVCNVDPEWLTGETDERGEYSEALMVQFLRKHGYTELANEQEEKKGEKKRRKTSKRAGKAEKKAPPAAEAEEAVSVAAVEEAIEKAVEDAVEKAEEEAEDDNALCISLQFQTSPAHQELLEKLEVEQAVYLLRALAIRSAYNEDDAQIYDVIKRCLLT